MARKLLFGLTPRDVERYEREQFSREFEERERREFAAERPDPASLDDKVVPF